MCKSEWWANKKRWFRDSFPGIMRGFIMVVIVAAVVCCIIGFFCPKFEYLDENNLVITFLGALAAFVVISNYAQMVEVRNQTDKRIKELEEKLENMNTKMDGMTRTIETDRDKIYAKFSGVEKMMYVDQGVFYRYYVIKQQDIYKMVEIKANYVFELSFSLFLSRYDNKDIINKQKEMLRDFGVPEDQLNN